MGAWTYLVFLVGFAAIVGTHELGHFIAAKLYGFEVPYFSIGFGPTILRFSFGGTDFRLSLFPIGGYIKIAGDAISEEEAVADIRAIIEDPGLNQEVKNRLSVSLLAYTNTEDVQQLGPWSHWYFFKSGWEQLVVCLSGPLASALLAVPLSMLLIFNQGNLVPVVPLSVAQVAPEQTVLHIGDEVLAIDNHKIQSINDYLKASISVVPGDNVELTVRRGDRKLTLSFIAPDDFASTGFGVVFQARKVDVSFIDSIPLAIKETYNGISLQIWALCQLLTGKLDVNQGLSGPVGIIHFGASSINDGFSSFVSFCRFLTEGLAIANLLPLPILDGGRSLISLWKIFTGRSLNAHIFRGMVIGGSIILLMLVVYVTVLDISRIV